MTASRDASEYHELGASSAQPVRPICEAGARKSLTNRRASLFPKPTIRAKVLVADITTHRSYDDRKLLVLPCNCYGRHNLEGTAVSALKISIQPRRLDRCLSSNGRACSCVYKGGNNVLD